MAAGTRCWKMIWFQLHVDREKEFACISESLRANFQTTLSRSPAPTWNGFTMGSSSLAWTTHQRFVHQQAESDPPLPNSGPSLTGWLPSAATVVNRGERKLCRASAIDHHLLETEAMMNIIHLQNHSHTFRIPVNGHNFINRKIIW